MKGKPARRATRSRVRLILLASVGLTAITVSEASAQEVTGYTYDALGRLTATSISGGPNNGIAMGTCFDPAGNRIQYVVASGSAACSPTPSPTPTPGPTPTPSPTPTPTPTPTNTPPVAVSDSTSFLCSSNKILNVLANDYDPDGNTPLSLVSATSASPGSLWVSISGSSSIQMAANSPGSYSVSYVVQDSLGATTTGYVSVTVTGNPNLCQEGPPE